VSQPTEANLSSNTETIPSSSSSTLTVNTLLMMAFAAGVTVANLYYNQPLLDQIRQDFGQTPQAAGFIPMLTQIGYATGMLFLVPIGDMREKKKLVLLFTLLSAVCNAVIAMSGNFSVITGMSFFLGLCTMTPQLLVPFAAHLAAPEKRGKVIGTMLSGILLGILLSRTISGFIGTAYGWRSMFGLAALMLVALLLLFIKILPKSTPSYHGHYVGLLQSVWDIVRSQPVLREACLFGAMQFGAFSAFWVTLIYLLRSPAFHLDARAVGLYGLLGAIAALSSPLFGSVIDRNEPRKVTGIMLVVILASFVIFYFSDTSLWGLGLGVLIMDIGVQCAHVANQSRIFKLVPAAQSRIQTAYMFCYFTGGAFGSYLSSWSWSHYGWHGVCISAMGLLGVALIVYFSKISLQNKTNS
jgi:predicted MFS family arabinose efflux permease